MMRRSYLSRYLLVSNFGYVALVLCATLTTEVARAGESLDLKRAIDLTLQRHPELRRLNANIEAKEADVDRARAPFRPQVIGSASYRRATANASGAGKQLAPDAAQSLTSYNAYNFGVTANQLVTDFGQSTGRLHAAQASRDAQKKSAQADQLELIFAVKSAFFQVQARAALLNVAEETLQNQRRHFESVAGFVEVGTRPPIDRVQAQADVQSAELNLVNAKNAYTIARVTLAEAMGQQSLAEYDIVEEALPPVPGEDSDAEALFRNAVRERADIQAGEQVLKLQQFSIDIARAGYYPSLSIAATMSEAGNEFSRLRWNASVGASLTWPIYDGGLTAGALRGARANLDGAQADLALLRQRLLLAVEQARLGVLGARQAVATSELLMATSRERLQLAEGRYQSGVGTLLEQADAQLALTAAQNARVQAGFNLSNARAALQLALGRY